MTKEHIQLELVCTFRYHNSITISNHKSNVSTIISGDNTFEYNIGRSQLLTTNVAENEIGSADTRTP